MKLLQGLAGSPAVYLSLAVLLSLHCCSKSDVINIPPVTQYANLSSTNYATFYCRTTGRDAFWTVNGETKSTRNRTEDGLVFAEVTTPAADDNDIHDIYLSIPTTVEYNETEVRCISVDNAFQPSNVSDIAHLFIKDPVLNIFMPTTNSNAPTTPSTATVLGDTSSGSGEILIAPQLMAAFTVAACFLQLV